MSVWLLDKGYCSGKRRAGVRVGLGHGRPRGSQIWRERERRGEAPGSGLWIRAENLVTSFVWDAFEDGLQYWCFTSLPSQ